MRRHYLRVTTTRLVWPGWSWSKAHQVDAGASVQTSVLYLWARHLGERGPRTSNWIPTTGAALHVQLDVIISGAQVVERGVNIVAFPEANHSYIVPSEQRYMGGTKSPEAGAT